MQPTDGQSPVHRGCPSAAAVQLLATQPGDTLSTHTYTRCQPAAAGAKLPAGGLCCVPSTLHMLQQHACTLTALPLTCNRPRSSRSPRHLTYTRSSRLSLMRSSGSLTVVSSAMSFYLGGRLAWLS